MFGELGNIFIENDLRRFLNIVDDVHIGFGVKNCNIKSIDFDDSIG